MNRHEARTKMVKSLGRIVHWLRCGNRHDHATACAVAKYLEYVTLRVTQMEIEMIGDVKKALRGLEAQRDAALAAKAQAEQQAVEAATAQAQAEKDAQALRDQLEAQKPFLMGQEDLTEVNTVLASLPPDPTTPPDVTPPTETPVDDQPPKADNPPA